MTTEDKAKAYDEIVQRVKELHEAGNDLTKKQMEIICPELAESEDERMLNKLIDHLDWHSNNRITHEECDELRSWLEKQKENPKSAPSIPEDCVSDVKCEDRWHKVGDSLPDNGREVLAKDKFGNTLLARYDGEGWDVSVYDDEDYRCHIGISKWCEIPSEKQKEQKPADLPSGFYVTLDGEKYYAKEMRCNGMSVKVVEPKPAEWSEEDDQLIGFIFDLLNSLVWRKDWAMDKKECLERLKSLRSKPHWKPSEEQMKALKDASDREFFGGYGATLRVLYRDLEKLI